MFKFEIMVILEPALRAFAFYGVGPSKTCHLFQVHKYSSVRVRSIPQAKGRRQLKLPPNDNYFYRENNCRCMAVCAQIASLFNF
jgi:hypothetical protein